MLALHRIGVTVLARQSHHWHEAALLVIVKGDVAQLHLAAGIIDIFDGYAMVGLCHVHFGTARRTNHFAVRVTNANLLAADLDALVDVITFAFVRAARRWHGGQKSGRFLQSLRRCVCARRARLIVCKKRYN